MDIEDYERIREIADRQEAILRFEHFSNDDAWELGKFLVQRIHDLGIEMAVAIRKPNGNIVFQYASGGTNLNNQNWMLRKFNTVMLMESSSLRAWAHGAILGEQIQTHGLSDHDYVLCGGGFPIRLRTGELVAVLTVSNLPHIEDHQFIVESLAQWLHVEDVPALAA